MAEWSLIRKIKSLNLSEKCFEWDELPENKDAEEQVSHFMGYLNKQNIEIYEVRGHQFMTENGIYTIANKEEIEYGE
jgi:hypothetical protein